MGSLGLWIRSEWRNGSKALLGLALLIALGGGVTLAAVAGARRADTAVDRFLDVVATPIGLTVDASMDSTQLGDVWDELAAEIAARPGVHGVTPAGFSGVSLQVDGDPISFFSPILGTGVGDDPPANVVVLDGRMLDSASSNEIALNEEAVRLTGAHVGDVIELRSYAADQFDDFLSGQGAVDRGPRIDVGVVAIVRGSEDVSDTPEPIAFLPAGFRDRYRDDVAMCDCSLAVNADREVIDSVITDIETTLAGRPMVVEDYDSITQDRVGRAVGLEVGALWIAAVIAGIAAVLVTTQAVARHVGGRRGSGAALAAIGVTRPELTRAWTLMFVPVAVIGAGGAVALALALSPLFHAGWLGERNPTSGCASMHPSWSSARSSS